MQTWIINLTSNTVTVRDSETAGEMQFRLLEMSQQREFGDYYGQEIPTSSFRTLKLGVSREQYEAFLNHRIVDSSPPIDLQGFPLRGVYLTERENTYGFFPDREAFFVTLVVRTSPSVTVQIVVTNVIVDGSQRSLTYTGAGVVFPVSPPPSILDKLPDCRNCRFFDGSTYGGNRLICGMHPKGYSGDFCGDREEGEKYTRDLNITRVQNEGSISGLYRELVQGQVARRNLSSSDFRESSDRYRVIAGGRTIRSTAAGSWLIFADLVGLRNDLIETLQRHLQGNHIRRFKLWLDYPTGVQEYFVSGLHEDGFVLHCPLIQAIEAESFWRLSQLEEDATSRDRALEQARRIVRSEFPEFTGDRATCGCPMCREERRRDEPIARPYQRDYLMSGFPIYGFPSEYQEWPRPRVQIRLPRMSVQVTNTATPVRTTQTRLRSALKDLSRIEKELKL